MFQTPLEDLPQDSRIALATFAGNVEKSQSLTHIAIGEKLVLDIANLLDQKFGLLEKPTYDQDQRLGMTLNQISINPLPLYLNDGKPKETPNLPEKFIIDPATIALIEKITGKITDLDIPNVNLPETPDEEMNANIKNEFELKSNTININKKKFIPVISKTSNLLKGTKSSVAKSEKTLESQQVVQRVIPKKISKVHEKLYQDAVRLKDFRESLQNLSTKTDPPTVEESLQLFKNELLTVHSINQRRKKPQNQFHDLNLKKIRETQKASSESLAKRELENQHLKEKMNPMAIRLRPKPKMKKGTIGKQKSAEGKGLSVIPDLDMKFSKTFRFRPMVSKLPRNPLLMSEMDCHHRKTFHQYLSRAYKKMYKDVSAI